jgi:hypothetical protein
MQFMRNFFFLCYCLLASLPIGAVAQTTNVSVSYQIANDWGAGYTANWYLTNNSTVTITNWVFEFDQPISSFAGTWNCTVAAGTTATHIILTNEGYNATIAPGAMVTFGYQGAPGGLPAPTNYILNGRSLSGAVGGGGGSLPTLSIADAGVARASSSTTNINFVVSLSTAATNAVAVNYTTADGSAVAGTDYLAAAGTLNFAPGVTQQIVPITVLGAAGTTAAQSFSIQLASATNALIARATATGTITNTVVTPLLTVNNPTIFAPPAGTNSVVFTLSLNAAANQPVTVRVATANLTAQAGIDYVPANQTVTFAAGQLQQTVSIGIIGSTNAGTSKTFALNLTVPGGLIITQNQGICTIFDNNNTVNGKPATGPYDYAEALQKALFFYEEQRSGHLPANNRVTWRGDAATGDGSDVNLDLTGGWFDAGDHVKFGFPMAGSATMLAWAGLECPQAFNETGQMNVLLDNLKWVYDYFIKCDILDTNGDTLEFYGQIGAGGADHAFWGPSEVMTMARPSYKVTRTAPGSDLCGETAAAFAAGSMLFQSSNPTYAATLLNQAKKLYAFADTYRGKYTDTITDAAAYYNSWSGYEDELMWGALWLYKATGDTNYLAKAKVAYNTEFVGSWGNQNYPSLKWTHSWDDKTYGSLVLFSMLTTNAEYRVNAEHWLDFWTVGRPDGRVTYTPGGLAWLDPAGWGNLRYAMTTAFLALVYSDHVNDYTNRYHNFAVSQVNYVLGSNPLNRSFICGFGNNPPINPHHRGAHGSWDNNISDPPNDRHILYGAMVGGPGATDNYTDDRSNYNQNEPACDYNAGLSGALAKMYQLYGGYTQPNFPVAEVPTNQFFVEASLNQTNPYFTEIRALIENHSAWPARAATNLHYRYFINLSELYAAGGTTNNVAITVNTLSGGTISGLRPWDPTNHIYYVEISYDGVNIVPGGSTSYNAEAQFRFTIPSSLPTSDWNPANDWSYQNLIYGNQNVTNTGFIPTYEDGVKLEGSEPPSSVLSPYANWQNQYFTAGQLADPSISGDAADPNHNGLPNLLEYAMGLNPTVSDPTLMPHCQVIGVGGQPQAVLTYSVNTAATDAAVYVDESTNLASWTPAVTQTLSQTLTGSRNVLQVELHPGTPLLPKLFLRLRAQRIN